MLFVFVPDYEHFNREPERHRHVCIVSDAAVRCCRGGWHSYVTRQHLRSVNLSHLARKTTAVLIFGSVDIRHSADGTGSLRVRHPSHLAKQQCENCTYV